MLFLSLIEIFDIIVMSLGVGFIFSDVLSKPEKYSTKGDDVINYYMNKSGNIFDLDKIIYAALITAPGIIMHELAHKFTAISFGLNATFHASYTFLIIGILLKLFRFPFIFFVPGYVSFYAMGASSLKLGLIALAGPLMNLLFFIGTDIYLKFVKHTNKKIKKNTLNALIMTKRINLFLFFLNMIPIAPFDGYSVFTNLINVFMGVI